MGGEEGRRRSMWMDGSREWAPPSKVFVSVVNAPWGAPPGEGLETAKGQRE